MSSVWSRRMLATFVLLTACSRDDERGNPWPGDGGGDGSIADAGPLSDPTDVLGIPKFVTPLPIPAVYTPTVVTDDAGGILRHEYTVDVRESWQQVLPAGYPKTRIWAYGGPAQTRDGTVVSDYRAWPGGTFEATRGVPVQVAWVNRLTDVRFMFPVDPTLHWADPDHLGAPAPPFPSCAEAAAAAPTSIPLVTHLHGGEVAADSDGFPSAYFTADGRHGPAYASIAEGPSNAATSFYPNAQQGTTLWYHDHALGVTRLNVLAGLAGFYVIRDPQDPIAPRLPSGPYEIPLMIQDRSFRRDGSFDFPCEGVNPDVHPYWSPEFFGDTIVVNGAVWPNLDVEPRAYRFRILNGSNARFYDMSLVGASNLLSVTQIGGDGGYLRAPSTLNRLLLGPGERADVVIDFSDHRGEKLRLVNSANSPFPGGDNGRPPNPDTEGQIMQFSVSGGNPIAAPPLPLTLAEIAELVPDQPPRALTLFEVMGANGPEVVTLNGQMWTAPPSETPRIGSTEDWQLVNLTEDAHTIHLHLVEFQVVSRQPFDYGRYLGDWTALNGSPTFPVDSTVKSLDPTPYLQNAPRGPWPGDAAWKDTVVVFPEEVTQIRVRFAPAYRSATHPGDNAFPFDPTAAPGYVWHCHILDHEDNEMMRPLLIVR